MRELLAELRRRDIRLRLVDGRVDVLAPPNALTPQLRDALRAHRDELRDLLAGADRDDDHRPAPALWLSCARRMSPAEASCWSLTKRKLPPVAIEVSR